MHVNLSLSLSSLSLILFYSLSKEFQRRIELIQDFEFRAASQRIKLSKDGQHILATGTYPPMIKCFDTRELSEKFKRHLDCEVVQFEVCNAYDLQTFI